MPDFGRAASDYAQHRAGFPPELFDRLESMNAIAAGRRALDIGTGTGTLARGLAQRGLTVTGVDIARPLLDQAERLAARDGMELTWLESTAEHTGLGDGAFDVVTAGQCWHWFDRAAVADECRRLLSPDGRLVITHLDWLTAPGNVLDVTEQAILEFGGRFSKRLEAGAEGFYPAWTRDVRQAGFVGIETFSFDVDLIYPKDGWRGRVRASAPIGGTLDAATVERFDALLAERLVDWPDPLSIPHRVWAVVTRKPS